MKKHKVRSKTSGRFISKTDYEKGKQAVAEEKAARAEIERLKKLRDAQKVKPTGKDDPWDIAVWKWGGIPEPWEIVAYKGKKSYTAYRWKWDGPAGQWLARDAIVALKEHFRNTEHIARVYYVIGEGRYADFMSTKFHSLERLRHKLTGLAKTQSGGDWKSAGREGEKIYLVLEIVVPDGVNMPFVKRKAKNVKVSISGVDGRGKSKAKRKMGRAKPSRRNR